MLFRSIEKVTSSLQKQLPLISSFSEISGFFMFIWMIFAPFLGKMGPQEAVLACFEVHKSTGRILVSFCKSKFHLLFVYETCSDGASCACYFKRDGCRVTLSAGTSSVSISFRICPP